jgi:tRNA pseudouridine55 synthase
MTSHDVVEAVRKLLGVRRVGHTGTLDPQATGVLPVCVGRATKIAQYLTQADKEYVLTLRLGIATDTQDAAGREISRVDDVRVSRAEVEAVLPRFTGTIRQVPPLFSAKRVGGERLYHLARRGQVVERTPVALTVHALELLGMEGTCVRLRVHCSKGTYARALCDDIGRALGVGGHLQDLVRTRSGRFALAEALTLTPWPSACGPAAWTRSSCRWGRPWSICRPCGWPRRRPGRSCTAPPCPPRPW